MKLFRNIRQNLIKNGNLSRYLLYAIGEILLVMIGISLAFQLDNWNENRIKRNNEIKYYKNIKSQIIEDKWFIKGQSNYNDYYLSQFKYANEIIELNDRSKRDTLGVIVRNITLYSDFDKEGNIYGSMVNSGELSLLSNFEIINKIRLLEEKYNYINRMENIHYDAVMKYAAPSMISTIKLTTNEIMKPELVYSFEFQNLILTLIQIMEEKTHTYTSTIEQIDQTIELIDKELKN